MHLEPGTLLLLALAASALVGTLAAFALDLARPLRRHAGTDRDRHVDAHDQEARQAHQMDPRYRASHASKAWCLRRMQGCGDAVSELLGAIGDVLAVRAGVTPLRHSTGYMPMDGQPWFCRWIWSCAATHEGRRVVSLKTAIGVRGTQRPLPLPFCERPSAQSCPAWLEQAVLERSTHQGIAICYPEQALRIYAALDTPSAHVALSAHRRLQAMLPAGLSVEEAIADLTASR